MSSKSGSVFIDFPWVGQVVDDAELCFAFTFRFRTVCVGTIFTQGVDDEFSLASTNLVEYFTEVDDVADAVGHCVCPLLVFAVAAVTAGEDAVSANVAEVDVLLAFVALDWFAVVE